MNGDSKDYGFVCQTLMILAKKSEALWAEMRNLDHSDIKATTRDSHDYVIGSMLPITSRVLEQMIYEGKTGHALYFDKKLLMPPLQENAGFIPVLSLKCYLNGPSPEMSVRVELYRAIKMNGGENYQSVGFRFEIHGNGSEHNYCHVQLSSEHRWEGIKESLPNCPPWIPVEIPRIPIMANCPVSLFMAVLVSFYGKRETEEMMKPISFDGKYRQMLEILWGS